MPGRGYTRSKVEEATLGLDLPLLEQRVRDAQLATQLLPPIAHPGRPFQPLSVSLDGFQDITSTAFVTCWDTIVDRVVHQGLFVVVPWQTGVGTTGELRVTAYGGFAVTASVVLPANSAGEQTFRWLHGLLPWFNTDTPFAVEARRTGGAGNVRTGIPYSGFVQVDPRGCTPGGV